MNNVSRKDMNKVSQKKSCSEKDATNQVRKFDLVDLEFSLQRFGGDRGLLNEIIQIFFEDAPELMRELAVAVKSSDVKNAKQTAHTLKGLVSNFGESEAVELVDSIELAAGEDDMASVRQNFEDLRCQYETLHRELAELVSLFDDSTLMNRRQGRNLPIGAQASRLLIIE